ncbi:hypothetical protein N7492_009254 [Penicillium capsulatum]|uniref:Uncharacterized protein n=1 Tax=Penicillium capsulatum TaxID=69766 RepID=A0A9W9HS63_9EURO|nr:hypothetical protein N7492_009254 [Penicillium capsulatum]KAJ6106648.1 hypothetical protein N7512_010165 [Penicillium capsulatum]
MVSFLTLPAELRALVIYQVLCSENNPPSRPFENGRIDFQDIDYRAWRSRAKILNENRNQHCPSNVASLLRTNRQLSAETQAILDIERQKSKLRYALDISVLHDYTLFVTWLSVPWISNRVDSLVANIRLFGHILPQEIAKTLSGDGGRLGFHWSFYAVLERFLRYGPVDGKKTQTKGDSKKSFYRRNPTFEDRDMTVKELTLNIDSAEDSLEFPPDEIDYRRWSTRHHGIERFRHPQAASDELIKYRTRPEWLAKYLLGEIRGLLYMGYHTASYGKILYESIGTLRVVAGGEEIATVDLASELASLSFNDPGDTFGDVWPRENRIPAFWEWKKQTLERRQQLGFPVVWPKDQN